MDIGRLKILYQIFEKSLVEEMIIKSLEVRLKIVKGEPKEKVRNVLLQQDKMTRCRSSVSNVEEKDTQEQNNQKKSNVFDILSPQIGFFSRFNIKTGKQYVKLRDVVKKGDIIGVITSMHVQHQVVNQKDGKITDFLVEENQPVEYHQPLARLLCVKAGD